MYVFKTVYPQKNPINAGEFSAVYFSYIIAFCFRIYCYYGKKY